MIVAYSESHDVHVGCDYAYIYLYIDRSKKGNTATPKIHNTVQEFNTINIYIFIFIYIYLYLYKYYLNLKALIKR